MAVGIKRKIKLFRKNAENAICRHSNRSRVAAGMAGEGFAGGYLAALDDVGLLLNGCDVKERQF
jgi:hypothetical protein